MTSQRTASQSTQSIAEAHLRELIRSELPSLVEFRHDLHAHPELKYEEKRTSQKVRKALTAAGIEFVGDLAGGTGILAHIPSTNNSASAIGLRADMDALPIEEATGLPYASTSQGKMHACGHDGHTTILLGAARVLKKIADENGDGRLPRPVKFVFQPAEEGGAGGLRMVEDGVLCDSLLGPKIERMYGLHCWPRLEIGKVATRVGPLLAAADMFHMTVKGAMSHAAWPHQSKDPIVAGAAIVNALQTIASRNIDPLDSIVVSTTMFHAGSATNVIPSKATLGGTLRTLSEETRAFAKRRIDEIATGIAQTLGCSAETEWEGQGYPVTENAPEAVEDVFRAGAAAVGSDNAQTWPEPVMGGEDFSFYCREVPSCFFVLGQAPQGEAETYPYVHTPVFNFNDDSIALGVEMFCRLALRFYD